ncbi:hypothetical protein COCCADRAFT_83054, partial [Bipolaris zeicola 26-R-13]
PPPFHYYHTPTYSSRLHQQNNEGLLQKPLQTSSIAPSPPPSFSSPINFTQGKITTPVPSFPYPHTLIATGATSILLLEKPRNDKNTLLFAPNFFPRRLWRPYPCSAVYPSQSICYGDMLSPATAATAAATRAMLTCT